MQKFNSKMKFYNPELVMPEKEGIYLITTYPRRFEYEKDGEVINNPIEEEIHLVVNNQNIRITKALFLKKGTYVKKEYIRYNDEENGNVKNIDYPLPMQIKKTGFYNFQDSFSLNYIYPEEFSFSAKSLDDDFFLNEELRNNPLYNKKEDFILETNWYNTKYFTPQAPGLYMDLDGNIIRYYQKGEEINKNRISNGEYIHDLENNIKELQIIEGEIKEDRFIKTVKIPEDGFYKNMEIEVLDVLKSSIFTKYNPLFYGEYKIIETL